MPQIKSDVFFTRSSNEKPETIRFQAFSYLLDVYRYTQNRGNHLNHNDAVKLSSWLGTYLAETQLFEDKRNLPAYASWSKAQADSTG